MTRRLLAVVVVSFLAAGVVHAQKPSTPGPEEQRLGVFVGSWQGERAWKSAPQGPATKTTYTEDCEWFVGNFQVVCQAQTTTGGKVRELFTLSYDRAKNVYKYYGISSDGMSQDFTGTVSGNTWTWTSETVQQGKPVKLRATYETAPTSLIAKVELSPDGKTWTVVGEGKGTKVK